MGCNPRVQWVQACRPNQQPLNIDHIYLNYEFDSDDTFLRTVKSGNVCYGDFFIEIKSVKTGIIIRQFDTNDTNHLCYQGQLPTITLVNCGCPEGFCQVTCANAPSGFCCIAHSLTDRLLQVLAG